MRYFSIGKRSFTRFTLSVIACLVTAAAASVLCAARVSNAAENRPFIDDRSYSWNWCDVDENYIVALDDGGYMTFSGKSGASTYIVNYYDSSFKPVSSKKINAELKSFGSFYSDSKGYYILTGQDNLNESASVECYRLTKYDKNWKRIGSCGLKDCNTYEPFEAGAASMASYGNYLVIRTCHTMYKSSDGYHHQANVTIIVNTSSMKILDSFAGVMNESYGYSSHSFNQYVKIDNKHIIGADHGDAYPRAMGVWYYKTDLTTGKLLTNGTTCYKPFAISGSIGDNKTGATLGGLEVSGSSYIIVGSSIDQNKSSSKNKNIFVSTVNKSSGSTATKWLTKDADSSSSYGNPYIVKISNSEFAVIWSRDKKVYYAFIDGNGNIKGSVNSATGSLSDCQPVLSDKKIVWYTPGSSNSFYYIDTTDKSLHTVREFTVTVEKVTNGKVSVSKTKAYPGEKITITVTPDECFEVDTIKVNGKAISKNVFTMGESNATVTVTFKAIENTDPENATVVGETAKAGGLEYTVTDSKTNGTGTVTLTKVEKTSETLTIPNTVVIKKNPYKVTAIGAEAFKGDQTIKNLVIGANIVTIDSKAFYGCSNLVSVTGGDNLVTIGSKAFAGCKKLKTFKITSPVLKKIGASSFSGDKKLKTIYIKNTTKLTKSGVKKSLKGSKVKTVKVKKSKVKKYKKYFKKKNSGRTVKVKK